jgi:hypothetical protein
VKIKIEYDGSYPNLCRGKLFIIIAGKKWEFPDYCLSSGGSVSFDDEWNENVASGPWLIKEWPKDFPDEFKDSVTEAINSEIRWGCCGGCV